MLIPQAKIQLKYRPSRKYLLTNHINSFVKSVKISTRITRFAMHKVSSAINVAEKTILLDPNGKKA